MTLESGPQQEGVFEGTEMEAGALTRILEGGDAEVTEWPAVCPISICSLSWLPGPGTGL